MSQDYEFYNESGYNPDWSIEFHTLDFKLSDLLRVNLNKVTLVFREKGPKSIGQILNHFIRRHVEEASVVEGVEDVNLEEAALSLIGNGGRTCFGFALHCLTRLIEVLPCFACGRISSRGFRGVS